MNLLTNLLSVEANIGKDIHQHSAAAVGFRYLCCQDLHKLIDLVRSLLLDTHDDIVAIGQCAAVRESDDEGIQCNYKNTKIKDRGIDNQLLTTNCLNWSGDE